MRAGPAAADTSGMETYEELATRAHAIADLSADGADQLFWRRYAANLALEASREIEETDGEAFRRERIAFSWVASEGGTW